MHAFLFSEINDFRKQRVGCFIETENCEMLFAVHRMLERRIPFIVMWPLDDPEYGLKTLWELGGTSGKPFNFRSPPSDFPCLPSGMRNWLSRSLPRSSRSILCTRTPEDSNEVDWSEAQQSWGVEEEESDGLSWVERAAGFDERRRQAMLAKAVDWRKWFTERTRST